ncbi:PEP-CTERM sorting domain-containing protein [Novosphingobium sp. PASSN1]|uniref:PEP-CTERM sorting domain-containing protein n=1 Tax=Novosphingobium sp. PASSN1 TaxID=2015561 RepID=UPI0025EF5FC1|nr:PEP-CTERM sorting domain-containing protein [Novosphingobium sp. PASSN1]
MMRAMIPAMALLAATPALSAQLAVSRYDMRNGGGQSTGGSSNYWDRNYNGAGCSICDYAALSGGVGDLTDGVAAAAIWFPVEDGNGYGPYVGWWDFYAPSPIVNFVFAGGVTVDGIAIHLDNSNFGGVIAPTDIKVDGQSYSFTAPTLGTAGWVTLTGLNLTGSQHSIQFVQAPNTYTFVSEVQFNGSLVPEPGQWALFGLGFAALGGALRRRRAVLMHSAA